MGSREEGEGGSSDTGNLDLIAARSHCTHTNTPDTISECISRRTDVAIRVHNFEVLLALRRPHTQHTHLQTLQNPDQEGGLLLRVSVSLRDAVVYRCSVRRNTSAASSRHRQTPFLVLRWSPSPSPEHKSPMCPYTPERDPLRTFMMSRKEDKGFVGHPSNPARAQTHLA